MIQNKNSKYQVFLKWFSQNGGLYKDIKFPTSFPPTDYIGISASKDIARNKVVLAIPKKLIIGVQVVQKSQLKQILDQYSIFQGQDNDDKDFNILTLFIIHEQMKGKQSFYHPYFQCIDIAETLFYWTDEEINSIKDPFLNIDFIKQIRIQFEPTFKIFQEISKKYAKLFPIQLDRKTFDFCYGIVMTRCFGWGLPETMIVPFADFLNHQSNGVHHYTFCQTLEKQNNKEYIKKSRQINLQIFGIDNLSSLPKYYMKNQREKYLEENIKEIHNQMKKQTNQTEKSSQELLGIKQNSIKLQHLSKSTTQKYLQIVRKSKLNDNYQCKLYLSSDSEDNDSQSDDSLQEDTQKWGQIGVQYIKQKKYIKKLFEVVKQKQQQVFQQPKPLINKQFQDGITFNWWKDNQNSYFIVSTDRNYCQGEQIFNSYGRRNNRFLLLWYGFTFKDNKYDSVPFRLWDQRIASSTGKMIFTRFITQKDIKNQIPVGDTRYSYTFLSPQFRLKIRQMNYELLAYLRYKIIKNKMKFKQFFKDLNRIYQIIDLDLQIQACRFYGLIIKELIDKYRIQEEFSEDNLLKKQRSYYAEILINSNADIIMSHLQGITYILFFLQKIKQKAIFTPQDLKSMYRSCDQWQNTESQKNISSKIFIHHYLKILQKFINSQCKA